VYGPHRYEDSAGVRLFIWDGENILIETNSAGNTNRDYTYRPQWYGQLVSQVGEVHHYDVLGSTVQLTDASQDVLVAYRYRAFGEQTVVSGSSPDRFTWIGRLGYYRQPGAGDFWVSARVYSPPNGRWISRDPVRAGRGVLHRRTIAASWPQVASPARRKQQWYSAVTVEPHFAPVVLPPVRSTTCRRVRTGVSL
jgi:hypothetical protein